MSMRIISRSMVKPAEPTWNGMMPLTEFDQISVITHASQLYFYNKPTQEIWLNPSNNKIMDTLKDSLSRALVPFYPLAGRLSWIGRGRMILECNAMGAELIEVESTMKIADFGDFYSCSEKFENMLVEFDYFEKPLQDHPVLAVQLTRFACGGLCVGISMSHAVADGRSSFRFVEEWARLARGEPLEVAPFLDRRVLQAEDPFVNGSIKKEEVADHENENYFSKLEKGKQATPTFVLLTKKNIEQLKEVANSETTNTSKDVGHGRPYNRFEVIAAHVWRSACKARELKDEDSTSFNVLVDARSRMDPPLPSSYFGNAVVASGTSSSAGELISKPLSYTCRKIREATTKVTSEYVSGYINHLKTQESLIKYQYFEDRGKTHGPTSGDHNEHYAVSWLNLATLGVDFGWGKEIYMGPCTTYCCDGNIMIMPYNKDGDGSVLVGVFLQPKQKFQEYMSLLV